MINNKFLLYGAYGYTGKLIVDLAQHYGLTPVLAGRDERKLAELARASGFAYRSVDLLQTAQLEKSLEEVSLVIHAAGPFIHTAKPMVEACLTTGTHYIDINGDISCFELVNAFHDPALQKGIMLLPGSGFDVIPTDCMALLLKKTLPDATWLKIAFANLGSMISHGTAMTMAGKMGEGASKRESGEIARVDMGSRSMVVDFGIKKLTVMNISWGDVFTAYHTTGIPNIETFVAVPEKLIRILRFQRWYNWLLRTGIVRNLIRKKIDARAAGPDEHMRKNGKSLVWARAGNIAGKNVEVSMEGPESYELTAHGALVIAAKILKGEFKPGYQTPAGCYGESLVSEIPGVRVNAVTPVLDNNINKNK